MGAVKEDMELVGETEEDAEDGGRCLAVATTRGRSLKERKRKRKKSCGIDCPAEFFSIQKEFQKNN